MVLLYKKIIFGLKMNIIQTTGGSFERFKG